MPTSVANFSNGLKTALTGASGTPLVLVGNIEVEDVWALGEFGLPKIAVRGSRAVVNRMDELGLLLAGPDDHVVLKSAPDPAYLAYLESLGLALPNILTIATQDPMRTVTEDALADTALLAALARTAAGGAQLWPHGVSELEERLAARSGLPLAAASAATCKAVNSKIYSRTIADELGLRQPQGVRCRTVAEFSAACEQAAAWLAQGRAVVLKDAYGVSGRGVLVVRDVVALRQVERMVVRRAARSGEHALALVAEEWVAKKADLNYQFTIDRSGATRFDFVKEALTESGVHKGHRMPARLTAAQHDVVVSAAHALGERLAADGYFGIVGVDALVGMDDLVYPVIEINARNNMSTYQERLRHVLLDAAGTALATQYPLRLRQELTFVQLRSVLGELLMENGCRTGVLVNTFATVNAAATEAGGTVFGGRLYCILAGSTDGEVAALDREMRSRLATLAASP